MTSTPQKKFGDILEPPRKKLRWGPSLSKVKVKVKKTALSPEEVADTFNIEIECVKQTLRVTTQKRIRALEDITKPWKPQLYCNREVFSGKWYSNMIFFEQTSIVRGENCTQVTTNAKGFTHIFPIRGKTQAFEGLSNLINDYRVPEQLITDGARKEGS